jgi:hypothetical protein
MSDQIPQETSVPIPALPLPIPEQIRLGQTSITVDNPEFIRAIGYGLESSVECLHESEPMSAQTLFERWMNVLTQDRVPCTNIPIPTTWRLGFLVGEIAGLLYPNLEKNPSLSYLELLSRTDQTTLPGTD